MTLSLEEITLEPRFSVLLTMIRLAVCASFTACLSHKSNEKLIAVEINSVSPRLVSTSIKTRLLSNSFFSHFLSRWGVAVQIFGCSRFFLSRGEQLFRWRRHHRGLDLKDSSCTKGRSWWFKNETAQILLNRESCPRMAHDRDLGV